MSVNNEKTIGKRSPSATIGIRTHGGMSGDCDDCPLRDAEFCGAVLRSNPDIGDRKINGTVRPRQHLYKQGEPRGRLMVLRDGWAVRFALTPDGRRQVLSIAVPGDIVGGEFLMRDQASVSAQTVTAVDYCAFGPDDLKEIARSDPDLVWAFVGICFSGREASEARLVDLGRRNAEQRIARLVLDIYERLARRGLAEANTMPFPLRQQIIADALGLTQVHVSRVMTAMREHGIIELSGGRLTIHDMQALRDIA